MVVYNNILAGASGQTEAAAFQIDRSLRFNSDDDASLSKTFSAAGNRKKWTWSAWIKRCKFGVNQRVFSGISGSGSNDNYMSLLFDTDDTFRIGLWTSYARISNAVFRDSSAWYHFCVAADLDNSDDDLKLRAYVNGSEISWTSTSTNPSTSGINGTGVQSIGADTNGTSNPCDIYLADAYFIDGLAISPVDNFIELDENGVYQARAYGGTFGTNGFHLDFSDNSSNAALGTDSSGNDNTFTVNNLVAAASSGTNYTNISTLAALSGSTLDSSYNDVSKVFDGSGTGVRTVAEVSNQGEKLSITFSPTITLSSETVSIDTSSTYQGMFVTVDGSNGSRVSGSDSNTTTLTTGSLSGSLSKITVDNGTDTSGRPASILRIRIGGTELRDPVAAKEVDSLFDAPTNGSQ